MCIQSPWTLMLTLRSHYTFVANCTGFILMKECARERERDSYERRNFLELSSHLFSRFLLPQHPTECFGHVLVAEAVYKGIQHGSENGVEG